jgi:hypothetical protein
VIHPQWGKGRVDETRPNAGKGVVETRIDEIDAALDEALEEIFPASDPIAPPALRESGQ